MGNKVINFFKLKVSVLFAVIATLVVSNSCQKEVRETIVIGNRQVEVLVMDTDLKKSSGIRAIRNFKNSPPLLFNYKEETRAPFTGEGVEEPFDIVFYDSKGQYVDHFQIVFPELHKVIQPEKHYLYVIEAPLGYFQDNGIPFNGALMFINKKD